MGEPIRSITADDLRASGWKDVVASAGLADCQKLAQLFAEKSVRAKAEGALERASALDLLERICRPVLRPDVEDAPLGHQFHDAISEPELQGLGSVYAEMGGAELQARVADVLWLRKKDRVAAEVATRGYLAAAQEFEDPKEWSRGFARTKRAYQIAASLGRKNQLFQTVVEFIADAIERLAGKDPLYLSASLLELLLESRARDADAAKYGERAEAMAQTAAEQNDAWRAERLSAVAAGWFERASDRERARSCRVAGAEAFVRMAAQSEPPGLAASHVQRAIAIYRRIGKASDRVDELLAKMREYQERSTASFQTFSSAINIEEEVREALEAVRGKGTFNEALVALATLAGSPSVDEMRKSLRERASASPIQFLIPQKIVDSKTGRTTGRRNGFPDDDADAILFQDARRMQHVMASILNHARRLVFEEHPFGDGDFLPLVRTSPFVPTGREVKFARGLAAGLRGDFMIATSLLVPQIENSLRHIVEISGGRAFGLDEDGIQDAHLLGHLLGSEEARNILGEDLVFDLRGLLNERFGTNLRNVEAHGLLDDEDYNSSEAIYFWWLTLRLCTVFALNARKREPSGAGDNAPGDAS